MLTPVDVQNKVFKGGIGYDKKDVETFMNELASDYSELYRSSVELKDKVATLDESLQHYRSIEESMQKALTLSEKTAEETVNAANDKARQINTEAEKKAEAILEDAKAELQETKEEIYRLQQQHATFKEQFSKILDAQLKLMDGEVIDIDLGVFTPSQNYGGGFGNYSGGGLGSEGGLGGLGDGGGYTGASPEGRERTNQEPAFDRGTSLNMDPFADAMNGGGRFSRQTGGAYNGNGSGNKKKAAANNNAAKSTLNVKNEKPGANKVKKNFAEKPAPAKQPEDTMPDNTVAQETAPKTSTNNEPERTAPKSAPHPAPQPKMVQPEMKSETVQPEPTAAKVPPKTPPMPHQIIPEEQVSGEVESPVNESNMLDSEDNYSEGFDFVSEDNAAAAAEMPTAADLDDDTVSGEVEDRINESNMLDSEDNYSDGFDFVSEEDESAGDNGAADEDAYVGEVEERVNESNMIDSEDNYDDGFDFVVGGNDSEEEGIPTINSGLNIDPFANAAPESTPESAPEDEDVLVGDVEENVKQSNLIGNADDEEEGFKFL